MKEINSFFEFIIDIFCFATPIGPELFSSVPRTILTLFIVLAIAFIAFLFFQKLFFNITNNKSSSILLSICLTILSFGFISLQDVEMIVSLLYVPLVLVMRGIEGALIAPLFKMKTWIMIMIILLILLLILYIVLKVNELKYLSYFALVWSFGGIIISSYRWVKLVSNYEFIDKYVNVSLFLIFLSSLLFISASKLDLIIYLIMFPLGFTLSLFTKTKDYKKILDNLKNRINY